MMVNAIFLGMKNPTDTTDKNDPDGLDATLQSLSAKGIRQLLFAAGLLGLAVGLIGGAEIERRCFGSEHEQPREVSAKPVDNFSPERATFRLPS